MELFISLKGGYKVECAGCLAKIKIGEAKVVSGKAYCQTCYPIINNNNSKSKDSSEKL